jgi:broad specificity phosphatase PhoE
MNPTAIALVAVPTLVVLLVSRALLPRPSDTLPSGARRPASGFRLRLALVRHAESMNNVYEVQGPEIYARNRAADPDISPLGEEQAEIVNEYLADAERSAHLGIHPIHEVWISPHKRTLQTAASLTEKLAPKEVNASVDVRFFERGGIHLNGTPSSGLPREEMSNICPRCLIPDVIDEQGWYHLEGQEPDDVARDRAVALVNELVALTQTLESDTNVVVYCHHDFINALLDAFFFPPFEHGNFKRWRLYNTGVTVLDLTGRGVQHVLAVNEIAHLVASPRAGSLIQGFGEDHYATR